MSPIGASHEKIHSPVYSDIFTRPTGKRRVPLYGELSLVDYDGNTLVDYDDNTMIGGREA